MAVVNSAYDARFQSSFKSVSGRDWWVTIYDRKWSSVGALYAPPYNFVITDNGLNIQYDCEGDEKFAPIVGSKLKLNFMVDYADTSEQQGDFIDDLLGYGPNGPYVEGDIFILIREGSATGNVIFCGEYLQDLDTLPDVSGPFPIQLTFTDGIGKLKETTWDSQNIDTSLESYSAMQYKSFAYWISQCLLQTNFYKTPVNPNGFWDGPSNKTGFYTSCRWYNSDMYYKPNNTGIYGDVLMQTQGTTKWANKFNPSNGQLNIASCYTVLQQICKSWGMRVISWQGAWYLYQIEQYKYASRQTGGFNNEWQTPIDGTRYQYKADGTPTHRRLSLGFRQFDRFNNYMYNVTAPGARTQKLQGGSYSFLPVLKEVKLNLVHEGYQNVFGGIPAENNFGLIPNPFIGGPFLNSAQFKFETNFHLTITTPSGANLTSWDLSSMYIRIIAMPPNSTTIANALATLTYDTSNQSYGWDDTPTYTGADLGPVINHYSVGGPYPSGSAQTISLYPKLKFPGYRDAATDYMIIVAGPISIKNQLGTLITSNSGFPYGASYIWSYSNPIDTTALNPPSWSTGTFNNYLSTIQPVSNNSSTANTIFVNTQTDDSHKLEWGDVYWGDGPEYWDDSALRIRTGSTTYEYSDWTSQDWGYKDGYQVANPVAGTGQVFTEQLALTMKSAQATVLKRANFKLADSPDQTTFGGWNVMVNPVGNIQDITLESDGTPTNKKFFFRRGSFNMIMNEWDGEWIEASFGPPSASSTSFKMAGGANLNGPGNTLAGALSSGSNTSAQPRLSLLRSTENVVGGTAISSITIQVNRGEDIDGETDFLLNVDYRIMTGDKVWMVYDNGTKYELTVTADVADNSTSLSFTEFTPEYSSPTPPLIQIPMLKVWENMNRKTSGSIAGFVVTADDLTKDGISIDGFLDSDTMTGASATTLPTSESVKAYVDSSVGASDTLQEVTDNGNTTTNSITFAGGTSTAPLLIDANVAQALIIDSTSDTLIRFRINGASAGFIQTTLLDFIMYNAHSGSFRWLENGGTERMRLTDAGNLGIGTTAPATKFEVVDNSSGGIRLSHANGEYIQMRNSGTVAYLENTTSPLFVNSGADLRLNATNSGADIYLDASGFIKFRESGVDIMAIDGGNVGIGTTAPAQLLSIYKDSGDANFLINSNNGASQIFFGDTESDNIGNIRYDHSSDYMRFSTNAAERMRITSAGNVGIGTTAPDYKLDVKSSNYVAARIESTSAGFAPASILLESGHSDSRGQGIFQYNSVSKNSWFSGVPYSTNSDDWIIAHKLESVGFGSDVAQMAYALFCINDNGNVGIGTTAPNQKLHVVGNAKVSGVLYSSILSNDNGVSQKFRSSAAADLMTILENGNVGIGTTNPLNKFVVADGTNQHGVEIIGGPLSYIQAYDRAIGDYGDLKIDAQTIRFGTDYGAERMRITSAGRIGIGTTAPDFILDIDGNNNRIRLKGTNGYVLLDLQNNGASFYIAREGASAGNFATGNTAYAGILSVQGNNDLQLCTNGIVRQTIDGAGNVGIGTTTPNPHSWGHKTLTVQAQGTNKYAALEAYGTGTASGAVLFGADSIIHSSVQSANGSHLIFTTNASNSGTSQSERMRITSAGNVGIGTTSPNAALDVIGELFVGNGTYGVKLSYSNGNQTGIIDTFANHDLEFRLNNTERMRITSAGFVGIGTTSPSVNLQIGDGTINTSTRFYHSDGTYMQANGYGLRFERSENFIRPNSTNNKILNIGTANYKFQISNYNANSHIFSDGSAERMRINSTGNVGIGTASPTAKLHVVGDAEITTNLKVDGSQIDFTNLPTSDPGVEGRLYQIDGTIKISI